MKMKMQHQFLTFIFLVVLRGLTESTEISDETKALLEVELAGQVDQTVTAGDTINYTLIVKHRLASKLEAVELEVEVLFPPFVSFLEQTTDKSVNDEIQDNSIIFKISALSVKSNHSIQFSLNISDESLTAGIHCVVTPVRLNYKSILVNRQVTSYKSHLTSVFNVQMEIQGCSQPLGMGDKRIKFYQLSSSSAHVDLKPDKARIGPDGDAWCATVENNQQFIQVALEHESRITAISTWGRKEKDSWVKKYLVMYSIDGKTWKEYSENGFPKEFSANRNRNTGVKHWFLYSIKANFIRIRPLDWSVGVCMRFELYGCATSKRKNCIGPLGMENGKIPSSSLSDSVTDISVLPENSRLNKQIQKFPYGWRGSEATEDWLQIDLGSQHKLSSIAIQGGYGDVVSSFYVTSFHLRYSNDTKKWSRILENNAEKIFTGPMDSQEAMMPFLILLPSDIQGRYFRILPDQFVNMKVLRTELYGCMVEPDFTYLNTPVTLSRRNVLVDRERNILFACVYTESRDKSSCRKTSDGFSWKAIPSYIVSIASQEKESGKLYGIDQQMKIVRSEDYGDTWYSISQKEWLYNIKTKFIQNTTNIQDILSTPTPNQNLTWSTNTGMEWGVSGNGVHFKYPQGEDWTLVATWSCCGH